MLRTTLRNAAHRFGERLDRAFVRMAFRDRRSGRRATRGTVMARLDEATELYPRLAGQGDLFARPPAALLTERPVRALSGGHVVDITWPSTYQGLHSAHRDTLARCSENAVCHGRWYRHRSPAPTIVCLHGWGAGQFPIEERAFQTGWLYRLGYDVVMATLPFHSRRAPKNRISPMFPSTDPMRSNEGFAQAVRDLRALIEALRIRGSLRVGVAGMSLGGFTTSLLATVEPKLDFAVPIIPFSSWPDLLWEHGSGTAAQQRALRAGITRDRFAAAFAATTPLRRGVAMDPRRILIVAGERDRVTPPEHAERLHRHFKGSTFRLFPGSHLFQLGRRELFRAMAQFLTQL